MSTTYQFTTSISDPIQLDYYLTTNLSTNYNYLIYLPLNTLLQIVVSNSISNSTVTTLVTNYSNPIYSQITGIQTNEQVYTDVLTSFTNGATITIGSNISLQNTFYIHNALAPILSGDLANKSYVDALVVTAGSGITKSGTVLSVNVDGASLEIFSNTVRVASGIAGTGLSGGSGVALSVNASQTLTSLVVSANLTAQSGINVNSSKIINLATPTMSGDATNKIYVDNLLANSAGIALNATGTVLNVLVDTSSISINASNQLQIASAGIGIGLSGGNGVSLSVNVSQTQITTVGTLLGLVVSGFVFFSNTTESSSLSTGALVISGGVAINKSLRVSGILTALSGLSANGYKISDVANPTNLSDVATKSYVDGLVIIPGNGLSESGTTLSVNVDGASLEISGNNLRVSSGIAGTGLSGGSGVILSVNSLQPQITSVGILTSLVVSGQINITSTTQSASIGTGSLVISGGVSIGKNINLLGQLFISNTTDSTSLGFGSIITLGGLSVANSVQIGGSLNMNSNVITNIATPVNPTDSTNKSYVDGLVVTAGTGLYKSGTTLSVVVDGSSIEIFSNTLRVASGIAGIGLSGGSGVALSVNSYQPQITTVGTLTSLLVSGNLTAQSGMSVNNQKITNLATPTNASDAASKSYVDSQVFSIQTKNAVQVATTIAQTISTGFTNGSVVDGVILQTGNRILVKNQTNPIENGVYIVQTSGTPIRTTDFSVGTVVDGYFVFVEFGTNNANSGWIVQDTGTDMIGTSNIYWVQFTGTGEITAGNAIGKTGNTLDVLTDAFSVSVNNNNQLQIASAGIGTGLSGGNGVSLSVNASQPQIIAVGIITTGTWNGNIISVTHGGTGTTNFTGGQILFGNGINPIASSSNLTFSSTAFTIGVTTSSTSTNTGALIVTGGISCGENINVQGKLTLLDTTSSTSSIVGSTIIAGSIAISNTMDATSSSNGGTFTTAGGMSVGKTLYANELVLATPIFSDQYTAIIQDVKSIATNGGTFTAGSWQNRILNSISSNTSGITLASNQISLSAGTYDIQASAPGFKCGSHQIRLYNVSMSSIDIIGTSEYSYPGNSATQTRSFLNGKIVLTSITVYVVQHRCELSNNMDGLGMSGGWGNEIYTNVYITKLL
jgi:hypothetical protein